MSETTSRPRRFSELLQSFALETTMQTTTTIAARDALDLRLAPLNLESVGKSCLEKQKSLLIPSRSQPTESSFPNTPSQTPQMRSDFSAHPPPADSSFILSSANLPPESRDTQYGHTKDSNGVAKVDAEMTRIPPGMNPDRKSPRPDKGRGKPGRKRVMKEQMKRPMNAYIVFCNEWRDRLRRQNPFCSTTELAAALGQYWRALTNDQKAAYFIMAAGQKAPLSKGNGPTSAPVPNPIDALPRQ